MIYNSIIKKLKQRILLAIISALIFSFSVDIILGLIYRNHNILNSFVYYLISIIVSLLVFQSFSLINLALDKKFPWSSYEGKRFGNQLFAHLFFVLIAVYIPRLIINYFFLDKTFYIIQVELINLFILLFLILAYNIVELGFYLLYKWRYSIAELERYKIENAEFRFEMLKNQVNPHFLFNSLNTLSSLIYENKDTAAEYIRKLSKVYRYVLEQKEKELVKLSTEMEFINAFIYLYELRFSNMLKFEIEVSEELYNYQIAPMTVQMLMENAVKHNIISKKKPLTININIMDDYLVISNNIQKKPNKEYSSELGLNNIKSRYAFISQKEVIVDETSNYFKVKIPLIIEQKN